VVGAIEGTHADIAPAIRPGRAGHLEARRIGRGIGEAATALWDRLGSDLRTDVTLGAGLHEVDLETESYVDGITLPDRPAVGAALVAGAHENTTPVLHRLPAFRPGNPKPWRTSHPQGRKWVLGSRWLQPLLLPLRGFPRVLPLQVLRLGDAALVGMPFEVTIASGRRISDAVGSAMASAGVDRVIVTSVANEYSGYVATAEEYDRQHYEGGHTLYGPTTQPFVTAHAARLAARVAQGDGAPVIEAADDRRFDLKVGQWFTEGPSVDDAMVPRRFAGPATFADPDDDDDATWNQDWFDAAPAALRWCDPMVRVEVASDPTSADAAPAVGADGRVADDQGWALEVLWLGPAKPGRDRVPRGTHRYRVRWHGPRLEAGLRHRFVLLENNGRPRLVGLEFD
jgi:neutral ceramidase